MLYPFKFSPILKSVIWGGDEICRFKHLHPYEGGIGESWEISCVSNHVSIVSNGALKGKTLMELLNTYSRELLGQPIVERFGNTFPLLIKFIDAKQPLSIQVHPNDELAWQRHRSFGKTELWYVIHATNDAYIYSGFKEAIDKEGYIKSLEDDSFINYLQMHKVKQGDAFFLPAGRVHAIGKGCFIAEIQETSDITYRIYDYNRKDTSGNFRELHTELAKNAIDYKVYPNYKLDSFCGREDRKNLVRESHFTTNLISGQKGNILNLTYCHESFVIFVCTEGSVQLTDRTGYSSVELKQGETVLVPAANINPISLTFSCNCNLLETYIE